MKNRQKLLTDEQWKLIEPLLPKPKRRRDRRGRPAAANRACLEGILWVLQTGAAWRFLPDEFPSPSTCWRRLQRWQEQGIWLEAWRALLGRWTRKVYSNGMRPSWTAASPRRKRGRCRRQNQAWQGDKVDGTGRRSRSSAGSSAGKCLSGRSYACGSHAARSPRPAPQRPAAAKAETRNCRCRLRL